ncbi:MAG: YitT family protein, partial [Oscillospiraceae bacterium]|nr:YitT family protein [Oscillospiraceae bacterium]
VINPNGQIPFLTVGLLTILINLPLFAIGGLRIGKKFFFGSLLGLGLSSIVMDNIHLLLEMEPLMAAIYGGASTGLGVGLVFFAGASTGGADIIVRLVKLKAKSTNIGQIAMTFDLCVVVLTGLVFGDISNALYTGITVFICGKVLDAVVYGFDNSKMALIITQEHEEVAKQIGNKLGRGATYLYSQGTYSLRDGKVVLVAIYPKQIAELKDLVMSIDPNAFIILQEAHQVLGDGFIKHTKDSL